ncbi:tripartite ATP-independent transporter DctM subunit [Bradyrhizobium sp. GM5.1]
MLTGMPISIALGLTVLSFMFTLTDVRTESVALKLFTGIESFEIMAIPFFILAGNFLTHGGVARRMITFATSLVGHWYGGLALSGVVACALFAAISGSSPATVVAIGSVILPAMVAQGFPKRFGAGVITTSGSLGILIPPSIPMVLFAVSTNTSVGKLFIAGIVPGMVLAMLLGATTFYRAWRNDYPRMPKATLYERFDAFRKSIWGILLIVIVIGGIYSGLFTPTEAAAVSAVYAFIVAVFIYKDLKLRDVPRVLLSSANLSAMLLYIITNAVLFSFLMTYENVPQALAQWMIDQGLGWIGFLLVVNLLLLLAGNVMEAVLDHPDHGADPVSGCDQARHRSDPFRHPDDGQHGGRAVPSAGRPQSLRRLGHRQDGNHRAHGGGVAMAPDHAVFPRGRDLLAGSVVVAAEIAGHVAANTLLLSTCGHGETHHSVPTMAIDREMRLDAAQ